MAAAMAGPMVKGGFSSQKREVLLLLKRQPGASLAEVAAGLGISKVAALHHLVALEGDRLVQREYRHAGVGRPTAHFRLSEGSSPLFPEAYTRMSVCALRFVEARLGRSAVGELLQQRAHEILDAEHRRFRDGKLPAKVAELARVRTEGGYMAEVGTRRRTSVEMLEHNCPILAIATEFPEACEVERRMFETLLGANVEVAHRVAAGDAVCRFLVRPKEPPS